MLFRLHKVINKTQRNRVAKLDPEHIKIKLVSLVVWNINEIAQD